MQFSGENIWIIGASCGIGEALAHELAGQGATLILSSRRKAELEALQSKLGSKHLVQPLDIANSEQVIDAAQSLAIKLKRIHRVIVLAAIYRPNEIDAMDIHFAREQVNVNIMGTINAAFAVLPIFDAQHSGQLVLCGSVAAYTGLPGGQPYCATKAAVMNFAESLHAEVPDYVDIKLVTPGFVRTRMTAKNNFEMPFLIEPAGAAKAIANGLRRNSFEIHFPKRFTVMCKFLRILPHQVSLRVTCKMRGKA